MSDRDLWRLIFNYLGDGILNLLDFKLYFYADIEIDMLEDNWCNNYILFFI